MSTSPAWRLSRAETVAREIEREIVDGALAHGSRLGTKDDLRVRFGVAAGTVNEVVRLLVMRGLVAAKPGPGGGLFVSAPSHEVRLNHLVLRLGESGVDSADCLAVRNALEQLVVSDAAVHRTKKDLADLRAILGTMAEEVRSPRDFLQANWALHRRLVEISPNIVLRAIYTTLLDTIEHDIEEVGTDDAFDGRSNLRVHTALVDAIESRDPARLRRALRRHSPTTELLGGGEISLTPGRAPSRRA